MRICFHLVNTENKLRLSFYYTNPQPVEKKLAKKCCSEKIEKQVNMYIEHLSKYEKKAVAAGNRELNSFNELGKFTIIED